MLPQASQKPTSTVAPCPSVAIQKAHLICGTYAALGSPKAHYTSGKAHFTCAISTSASLVTSPLLNTTSTSKGAPAITSKGGAVSAPTSDHHKTSYCPPATSKGGPVAASIQLMPLCQCNRLANTILSSPTYPSTLNMLDIYSPITHFAHCKGVLRSSFSTDTKDVSILPDSRRYSEHVTSHEHQPLLWLL